MLAAGMCHAPTLRPPRLLVLAAAVSLALCAAAQREGRVVTHGPDLRVGMGVLSFLRADDASLSVTLGDEEFVGTTDLRGTPATLLDYSVRVGPALSLGGSLGQQAIRLDDIRLEGFDREAVGRIVTRRTFATIRLNIHYARSRGFELYSGLRLGITSWTIRARGFGPEVVDVGAEDLIPPVGGILPLPALMPLGCRARLAPGAYLTVETNVGSPYFLGAGLGYRFGEGGREIPTSP